MFKSLFKNETWTPFPSLNKYWGTGSKGRNIEPSFPSTVYSHSLMLHDNIEVKESIGSGILPIVITAEGEAEYFNLQGQRVENPACGTIVIRRCAGKVVIK